MHLRGDETLMDAGCGTGRLTAELLQSLPRGRVVGVDLSVNMLAGARDYLASDFGGKFLLVAADLQDLPFEGVFDGIFSTAAFHWVLDHRPSFSEPVPRVASWRMVTRTVRRWPESGAAPHPNR